MLIPTLVMAAIAVVVFVLAYQKGVHGEGLRSFWTMLWQIMPMLIFAFLVAGLLPRLIPQEIISRWVGAESGWRGILIGSLLGGISPGGPFVSMPLAAGLLRTGAGIGTMVAFITGWSLLAFTRLPMEISILGWKFVAIRLACTFFFPPIAGFIASRFFGNTNIT